MEYLFMIDVLSAVICLAWRWWAGKTTAFSTDEDGLATETTATATATEIYYKVSLSWVKLKTIVNEKWYLVKSYDIDWGQKKSSESKKWGLK